MKIHTIRKKERIITLTDEFLRVNQCVNLEIHNKTGAEPLYECEIGTIKYLTREQIDCITGQKNCLGLFLK